MPKPRATFWVGESPVLVGQVAQADSLRRSRSKLCWAATFRPEAKLITPILTAILLAALINPASAASNQLSPEERTEGFRLLFNGETLAGWHGDTALWSVKDGVIVGSTENQKIKHNSFLISNHNI